MPKRTLALSVCAAVLLASGADARRRVHRTPALPPPQPAAARSYTPPDDLPEPQRSTYQVLHAFGKE